MGKMLCPVGVSKSAKPLALVFEKFSGRAIFVESDVGEYRAGQRRLQLRHDTRQRTRVARCIRDQPGPGRWTLPASKLFP